MTCKEICQDCTCGLALSRAVPANSNFAPVTERPAKVNRIDFKEAAKLAAERYKRSMQILA